MRKVKEYLDKYFYQAPKDSVYYEENSTEEKANGHLCVHGYWQYPKNWKPITNDEFLKSGNWKDYNDIDHMFCSCNNETIQFHIIINNKMVGQYGYLQTYAHLPRNGPDRYGYYQRSTDEEVIRYINQFYQIISRKEKLEKINEIN